MKRSKSSTRSNLKALEAIIHLMRSNGVVSYKSDGIELILLPESAQGFKFNESHNSPLKSNTVSLQTELNKVSSGFHGMTEEEVLFHSAPQGN